MYESLMTNIESMTTSPLFYVSNILGLVATGLLFVYMYFTSKHKNQKLGFGWYICGYFFPLITAIVFIKKSKKFPGPDMKVCPACGDKYPKVYEVCGRCLAPLPEASEEEKNKNKKLSKITGIAFWIAYVIATAVTIAWMVMLCSIMIDAFKGIMDGFGEDRIGITSDSGDTFFYDKKGNSYENAEDVIIYGKDGKQYTYTVDTVTDQGYEFEEDFYIDEKGKKYDYYNCYVNEDGWFVYDEDEEFDLSEEYYEDEDEPFHYDEKEDKYFKDDGTEMSTDEVIAYYSDQAANYKYYDEPYYDEDGNIYYWAAEASWNEKGELITAKNDPTVK